MRSLHLLIFCVLVAFGTTVHATSFTVLDQDVGLDFLANGWFGVWSPGQPYNLDSAQTFTVGITGLFSRADVLVSAVGGRSTVVNWDIRPVSALQTPIDDDEAALARGSLTLSNAHLEIATLDLSEAPIPVNAGDKLAIVLSTSSGELLWGQRSPGGYEGGAAWQRSEKSNDGFAWHDGVGGRFPCDLSFRTFVTVPEPSTLSLFGMGGIGLIAFAWRRRK